MKFLLSTRAAEVVLQYVQRDPDLRSLPLDFEYGLVDGTTRAVGKFSGRAGRKRAVVWVTASTRLDGRLQLTHAMSWLN